MVIVEKIVMMFLILFVGVFCYKKNIIDAHSNAKLSTFLLQVVNPIVIFVSYQMSYDAALLRNLFWAVVISAVCFVVQILASHLFVRKRGGKQVSLERLSIIYANSGFIGIPLVNSIWGREGVFYLTGFLTVFYLFFWTHGVIIMSGKSTWKSTVKSLLSPAVIGVLLGVVCFLTQLTIPSFVLDALESIGSVNTPLAMLVAGVTLGQTDIGACIRNRRIYYIASLRLIVLPLLIIPLLMLVPSFSPVMLSTILIAVSCPVGACCTMFAIRYNKDSVYASQLFAATTLFSAITIPCILQVAAFCSIV